MRDLANALLASIWAAAALGPNTFNPCAAKASARPAPGDLRLNEPTFPRKNVRHFWMIVRGFRGAARPTSRGSDPFDNRPVCRRPRYEGANEKPRRETGGAHERVEGSRYIGGMDGAPEPLSSSSGFSTTIA